VRRVDTVGKRLAYTSAMKGKPAPLHPTAATTRLVEARVPVPAAEVGNGIVGNVGWSTDAATHTRIQRSGPHAMVAAAVLATSPQRSGISLPLHPLPWRCCWLPRGATRTRLRS
jgi:hypothetical protein